MSEPMEGLTWDRFPPYHDFGGRVRVWQWRGPAPEFIPVRARTRAVWDGDFWSFEYSAPIPNKPGGESYYPYADAHLREYDHYAVWNPERNRWEDGDI